MYPCHVPLFSLFPAVFRWKRHFLILYRPFGLARDKRARGPATSAAAAEKCHAHTQGILSSMVLSIYTAFLNYSSGSLFCFCFFNLRARKKETDFVVLISSSHSFSMIKEDCVRTPDLYPTVARRQNTEKEDIIHSDSEFKRRRSTMCAHPER